MEPSFFIFYISTQYVLNFSSQWGVCYFRIFCESSLEGGESSDRLFTMNFLFSITGMQ